MARESRKSFRKLGIAAAALLLSAAFALFLAPASRAAGETERSEELDAPSGAAFVAGNFWWRAARDGSGQPGALPIAGYDNR